MSKTRLAALFWIFALFLFQNALIFIWPGWVPQLLVAGVIFYALTEGQFFGLVIGCFAGFILDLMGVGALGTEMAVFGLLGLLCGSVSSKVFRDSPLVQSLLPAAGYYLVNITNLLIFRLHNGEAVVPLQLLVEALDWPQLIFMAAVSPFIFSFLKQVSFLKKQGTRRWTMA